MEYLGHRIDKEGISALPRKVKAIANAPHPTNVQELRSFLGLINYYGKFIQDLATLLYLPAILQANKKWEWTTDCTQSFQAAKDKLMSAEVLTHYNPELPLRMAADASSYGIGAVISHVLPLMEVRNQYHPAHSLQVKTITHSSRRKHSRSYLE